MGPDVPYFFSGVPGVIITGGSGVGVKAEVFNPHSNHSCSLPDLPLPRRSWHTHCGLILCGGFETSWTTGLSCLKLNPLTGVFTTSSVSLVKWRQTHLCWDVEGEDGPILLLGGTYGPDSTELVSSDGLSSSPSFNLTYDTE